MSSGVAKGSAAPEERNDDGAHTSDKCDATRGAVLGCGGVVNLSDENRARSALERARDSGKAEVIAQAAASNVWPLYSSHFELLIDAIESLPGPMLENYPVLRALHRITPVLARTNRPFKPLVYVDDARTMSADELDILTLVQMVSFRYSGDVTAARIYASRLEDRILRVRTESRERTDGPLWYYHYQIGSTLLAAGDSERALLQLATARQLGRLSLQRDAERICVGRMALAHAVRGSLDDAELALAESIAAAPATAAHVDSARATARAVAALIGVERLEGDVDALVSVVDSYDSIQLTWPFALLARTRALLASHRADEALEAIRLASDAHPSQHGSFASDVIAAMSIEAHCFNGDLHSAHEVARGGTDSGILTLLALARLSVYASRFDLAAHYLRQIFGDHSIGPGQRAEAMILAAWLDVAQSGRIERSAAMRLVRLARKPSTRRLFAMMPRQFTDVVLAALPPAEADVFSVVVDNATGADFRPRPPLTRSELRVLQAIATRETTVSIAEQFQVSPNTVKTQLKSVYRKLGCSTRAEALTIAARFGLLGADDPAAAELAPRAGGG